MVGVGIQPQSLHRLKDHPDVCSKKRMSSSAAAVVDNLPAILEETRNAVHVRTPRQGFRFGLEGSRLSPNELGVSKAVPGKIRPSEETLLEFALLEAHRQDLRGQNAPWARLLARQVPLMAKRSADGWGAIDLFGLTADGRPVVVELKKGSSQETPLRALLEAAAYAVSVEENWELLASEIARVQDTVAPAECPRPLAIIVAAPTRYWREWDRWSTTGRGVPADTRSSLRAVAAALSTAGISPSFVAIDTGTSTGSTPLHRGPLDLTVFEPWLSY